MFKEIRRTKQILDPLEAKSILKTTLRGVLSLNSEDGYPYGMPMNHFYDEDTNRLYFHGGINGYKIDCINKDNKCSFCVIDDGKIIPGDWAKEFKSVIVFGKIFFVDNKEEIYEISKKLSYKFTNDNTYIANEIKYSGPVTKMFYIQIEHMSGKKVSEK